MSVTAVVSSLDVERGLDTIKARLIAAGFRMTSDKSVSPITVLVPITLQGFSSPISAAPANGGVVFTQHD